MEIYRMKEYDEQGRLTAIENFLNMAARDQRINERKAMPVGTVKWEKETFYLNGDTVHVLNQYYDITHEDKVESMKQTLQEFKTGLIEDFRLAMQALRLMEERLYRKSRIEKITENNISGRPR